MRTRMFARLWALAVAVAALILGMGVLPAHARPRGRCDRHRPAATRATHQVLVYETQSRQVGAYGEFPTTYNACARPGGPSLQVGVSLFTGKYGSEDSTSNIVIAGPLVGALRSHGQADTLSCGQYGDNTGCPEPGYWVRVVNVETRRQANLAAGNDRYSTLVLSAKGAAAWLRLPASGPAQLEAAVLRPQGSSGFSASPATIDTGNIDRHSVRLVDRRLYWTRDGQQHQQTLS